MMKINSNKVCLIGLKIISSLYSHLEMHLNKTTYLSTKHRQANIIYVSSKIDCFFYALYNNLLIYLCFYSCKKSKHPKHYVENKRTTHLYLFEHIFGSHYFDEFGKLIESSLIFVTQILHKNDDINVLYNLLVES